MDARVLLTLWLCGACAAQAQYRYQYPPTQYPIYYTQAPPAPPQVQPYSADPYAANPYQQQYGGQVPPLPQPLAVSARGIGPQQPPQQQPQQQQPQQVQPQPQQAQQQPQQLPQQTVQQRVQQPVQTTPSPLATAQAAQVGPLTEEEVQRNIDAIITRGVTQLSLSLAQIVERDGDQVGQVANVVFSPVNVASALALVLAGSNGTTFKEIAEVLGIASGVKLDNREMIHREFGRYLSQLETSSAITNAANASGGNQVVFANGLFVQREFNIHPTFASIASSYKSEVIPVEFAREPTGTKERINSWFAEHTMGRIRSVLSEAPPTDTRLMIASALFFNGAWEAPFPIEATMTRPFYGVGPTGNREAFAVRMMTNNMDLPFVSDRDLRCRLLELPYKGRDVSMFFILPDVDGLEALRALEAELQRHPDKLEQMLASRKDAPVIYTLPRMKLQRSISLRTALETLGVRTLFDERLADLTHLSDSVTQRGSQPQPAAAPAPQPAPPAQHGTTPPPTTVASRPRPTRRPQGAGENTITPEYPFYFSNRMGEPGDQDNNTVQPPVLGDRWNVPSKQQQQYPARLYADDVLHKVEVEVTETGTVASAATAITISRDGSNNVLRFNRPFIFFIRHQATGLILFYGTVVRPMPEWIVPDVDVSQLTPVRPLPARQPPPPQGRRPAPQRPRQQQQQQPPQQQPLQQRPPQAQAWPSNAGAAGPNAANG